MNRLANHFSRIYVEEQALNSDITNFIINKFSNSKITLVAHYKDVFNRPRQNIELQRQSRQLILATKRNRLLYDGSDFSPNFGSNRFFYNTLILNCIYDCHYCYLQGMFPSAQIVVFVNQEDFKKCVIDELKKGPLYLCISYDTDLLAFDPILPLATDWVNFARSTQDLKIELRTKSNAKKFLKTVSPVECVTLAWTLSPEFISRTYEYGAPNLAARLNGIKSALAAGWKVRICIDPIIYFKDWEECYLNFIKQVISEIPPNLIREWSLGVFRMNSGYFKQASSLRSRELLFSEELVANNGVVSYKNEIREVMLGKVSNELAKVVDRDLITIW